MPADPTTDLHRFASATVLFRRTPTIFYPAHSTMEGYVRDLGVELTAEQPTATFVDSPESPKLTGTFDENGDLTGVVQEQSIDVDGSGAVRFRSEAQVITDPPDDLSIPDPTTEPIREIGELRVGQLLPTSRYLDPDCRMPDLPPSVANTEAVLACLEREDAADAVDGVAPADLTIDEWLEVNPLPDGELDLSPAPLVGGACAET